MPGRARFATLVVLAAFACFVVARGARGDDDVEAARRDFNEGVRLFQAGDDEGARRLFLKADAEHHAPVISYNIGRVEERLNHPQAAVDAYEKYIAEAGDQAEFAQAAVVAIAQIKARSGKLRVESEPTGARVFINGSALAERTPFTILVAPGHHHVVCEGESYRASDDVTIKAGESRTIHLVGKPGLGPTPTGSASGSGAPPIRPPPPPSPDGLVFGASFVVVPYYFNKASNEGAAHITAAGAFAGLSAEVGYAFTPRAVLSLRALGALGSQCKQVLGSHLAGAGPSIAVRLTESFWIGGSLLGGNGETCRDTGRLSTDIVFSPSIDASYAVASPTFGQWLISASLGFFFANPTNDNQLLYAPIGFGPRFF